jgi:3-deoxy-manno-octulosonate cytidylyltransferase (CMP-KDO synthetase)
MNPDVIIPARMGSSRFPGKPLVPIQGLPLVVRVCQRAAQVFDNSKIYVATESQQIGDVVQQYGYQVVFTSQHCVTGTDRIAEAARIIGSTQVINLQGDEPLVRAEHLRVILEAAEQRPDVTHNCYARVESMDEMLSRNVPKVVVSPSGSLLYASRAPIPLGKVPDKPILGLKQVCIYYFPEPHLQFFGEGKRKSPLEAIEDIEILRLVENSNSVFMHELKGRFQAVDEISDVLRVEKLLGDGN